MFLFFLQLRRRSAKHPTEPVAITPRPTKTSRGGLPVPLPTETSPQLGSPAFTRQAIPIVPLLAAGVDSPPDIPLALPIRMAPEVQEPVAAEEVCESIEVEGKEEEEGYEEGEEEEKGGYNPR